MSSSTVTSDILGVLIYVTVALCAGLLFNQFSESPLPLLYKTKVERLQDSVAQAVPASEKPVRSEAANQLGEVTYEDLASLVAQRRGTVLDARPEIFYRLGHIPGAISLPRDDFDAQYAKLRPLLNDASKHPIVVYCSSSSCEDSQLVGKSLISLSYADVAIFREGWAGWTKFGGKEEVVK